MIFTPSYNLAESFKSFIGGWSVFLIGLTMVFVVLFLLIILINIVGSIVNKTEKKTVVLEEIKEPQEINTHQQVDEMELIAVITAAVAASLGTTTDTLVVRSLRQVNKHIN